MALKKMVEVDMTSADIIACKSRTARMIAELKLGHYSKALDLVSDARGEMVLTYELFTMFLDVGNHIEVTNRETRPEDVDICTMKPRDVQICINSLYDALDVMSENELAEKHLEEIQKEKDKEFDNKSQWEIDEEWKNFLSDNDLDDPFEDDGSLV
jgi:hypothetical protein